MRMIRLLMLMQDQFGRGGKMGECPGITDEQLATTNGCGSSYWLFAWLRLPRWYSERLYCACCKHDLRYQDVESLDLRFKRFADIVLIKSAMKDAINSPSCIRWLKIAVVDLMRYFLSTKASEWCWYHAKRSAQ